MCSCYLILGLFVVIFSEPVMSSWEFVVSTKGRINFYTPEWELVTSAAHQFDELSAIAFDEIEEILYFNDQSHQNSTIFSLKLSPTDHHESEGIVKKTQKEKVQGIALDPLERTLYWTDATNGIIYQMNLNTNQEPSVFMKDLILPQGIAIDVCRRKLYWTSVDISTKNSTIGIISLDVGSEAKNIIYGLDLPRGIVVDQFSERIFWVDDLVGEHFTVESANLDGSDRKTIVKDMFHSPFDVTVDESNIYWTDTQENAVWTVKKNASDHENVPVRIKNFTLWNSPKGIIRRNHFMTSQAKNPDCKSVIDMIKTTVYPTTSTTTETFVPLSNAQCLNNGRFDEKTKSCHCQIGYKGNLCEIPICYNYCIEGTCHVTSNGNTQCKCNDGFSGERCEIDLCSNHCLHGGHCTIENGAVNCQCPPSFYGNRCENMDIKEMCIRFCNNEDIDYRGFNMQTICNNCSNNGSFALPSYYNEHENTCKESTINKTAIFVSCGVVISLALVFVIVKTIRHVYKPLRPRIKKTYVVRKNVTPTPLTSRPSTEQCEITIENCCNMNICDTPCFDPKVLQAEANKKEDKKTLIHHSEDLMY